MRKWPSPDRMALGERTLRPPENERCDELAREAASGKQLAEDSGYQP